MAPSEIIKTVKRQDAEGIAGSTCTAWLWTFSDFCYTINLGKISNRTKHSEMLVIK